jgi:phosphonate transport system substrate-binding protein
MRRNRLFLVLSLIVAFAMILTACKSTTEPTEAIPITGPQLGTMDYPIKVLFVPSVDVDFMIESGDLIAEGLHAATGLYFEVSIPTSYAATIEEMCASPDDTVGFIPAMGYALANQLCGVTPGLAAERRGWNVYWTQFLVARDSPYQTLEDLDGASWAYPDASSTSGFLYPSVVFEDLGITPGEQVEAGGHPQVVKAIYNGEADFGTSFYSPPLLPEGRWDPETMAPDIPDEVVDECVSDEEGAIVCGGYTVLDSRLTIFEEAPDVIEKVRVLALSPEIVNDTMSFSPEFSEELKQTIIDGVTNFILNDPTCYDSLCHESFYGWTGIGPIYDENFDGIRLLMEAQGITLENIGG